MKDFNSIKSTNNVIKDLSKKENWAAVLQKLSIASDAFKEWKQTSFDQRSQLLNKVAQILDKNS